MYKRNLFVFSTLLLILILALAACGGGEVATNTPEPTDTPPPTDIPEPTSTPEPTVDAASLPVADLEATVEALEAQLEAARASADGAAGEAAGDEAKMNIRHFERQIKAVQALIEESEGGQETQDAEAGEAEATEEVTLTLSGSFEEAREWTWEELEAVEMVTATVTGPGEGGSETEYTGVSMSALLEAAGVAEDTEMLVVTNTEDISVEIELEAVRECAACMLVLEDDSLRLIMPDFPDENWVTNVVSLEAQ